MEIKGVSTTMKMSTKGPNEDYARLSCQLKERPQLVCQKRISNRFVHLPRCALFFSLVGLQAWYSLCIGRLRIFLFYLFLFLFCFFLIIFLFLPFYAIMLTFVFGLTLSLSKGKCTMLRQTQNELLS